MDKINRILQEYFGYSSFKPGQQTIIEQILNGRDVLGVMPTGAGKSLCFQVPALAMEGTTIVISPLISLMKDQVDTLNEMGIPAAFINSSLGQQEYRTITANARQNRYKLLYIAPERLETESFYQMLGSLDIAFVAIDEAHCVSQWGHDFRPSYVKISQMIEKLPKRPAVAAFTATATPEVKDDIERLLRLNEPYVLVTGFDRENLYLEVQKPSSKFDFLLDYIRKNKDNAGIVYCATRKVVEEICQKLNKHGLSATRYHAGLTDAERSSNQEDFINDRAQVIIATNAFGMGIDKSNIRYVVHYNMPKTMENYYQEAGRAGRDGEKAECILLFSPADTVTNKLLIENSGELGDKSGDYKKLQDMVDYCNTDGCLRACILTYFGETEVMEDCGNCINCLSDVQSTNITLEAQKILSCIKRMGERFGSGAVTDVLRGSGSEKLKAMGFDTLSTFGIMKDYSKDTIKEIIAYLVAEGYIDVRGDKYPVLALSPKAYEFFKEKQELSIKRVILKEKAKPQKKEFMVDQGLFDELRQLRRKLAEEQQVPPFVVFSDAALKDMCQKLPRDMEELLRVSGVGKHKQEKYGQRIIELIGNYVSEHNIVPAQIAVTIENKERKADEAKKDTRLITYELYTSGKTLKEICQERGLTQVTVESHLIDCIEKGMELDYDCFIPEDMKDQIFKAIEEHGADRLKPIKEALPDAVTYTMIKFAICKYKSLFLLDRS